MEALCSDIVVLDRLLSTSMEALVVEVSVAVTKSLACLLLMMGAVPNGILECRREPRQLGRLPVADHMEKQPVPENKDARGTEEDGEDNDVEKDDDAGEEDEEEFPGEEGDVGDVEDDPEANDEGESEDDYNEEDEDDDEDEDEEDEEEEEEEEEKDEEIPQPPAKRRK